MAKNPGKHQKQAGLKTPKEKTKAHQDAKLQEVCFLKSTLKNFD
jgi:hypothetical protein